MRQDFYVYLWLRVDLYSPFYVGKGSGYRDTDRQRKGVKPPRDKNRIRRVATNLTEQEAFDLERKLIEFYGRKCDGGILQNITEGGEGHCRPHSQETKDKLSVIAKARYANKTNHPRLGAEVSGETRELISAANTGKVSWNKGVRGYKTQPASEARRAKVGKGCEVKGVYYPTQSHAARAEGVSAAVVSWRCRSESPSWVDWCQAA